MMTGVQHIARLMGTFQSIEENQKFPVIMSNFCNGFGYSWKTQERDHQPLKPQL